jgi:2TM domain
MYYNEMDQKNKSMEEERKGLLVHSIVTVIVCILLLSINLIFTPEFLWFVFPWIGMSLGVAFHYFMGIRRAQTI